MAYRIATTGSYYKRFGVVRFENGKVYNSGYILAILGENHRPNNLLHTATKQEAIRIMYRIYELENPQPYAQGMRPVALD